MKNKTVNETKYRAVFALIIRVLISTAFLAIVPVVASFGMPMFLQVLEKAPSFQLLFICVSMFVYIGWLVASAIYIFPKKIPKGSNRIKVRNFFNFPLKDKVQWSLIMLHNFVYIGVFGSLIFLGVYYDYGFSVVNVAYISIVTIVYISVIYYFAPKIGGFLRKYYLILFYSKK